jgi:hypothetical protein
LEAKGEIVLARFIYAACRLRKSSFGSPGDLGKDVAAVTLNFNSKFVVIDFVVPYQPNVSLEYLTVS